MTHVTQKVMQVSFKRFFFFTFSWLVLTLLRIILSYHTTSTSAHICMNAAHTSSHPLSTDWGGNRESIPSLLSDHKWFAFTHKTPNYTTFIASTVRWNIEVSPSQLCTSCQSLKMVSSDWAGSLGQVTARICDSLIAWSDTETNYPVVWCWYLIIREIFSKPKRKSSFFWFGIVSCSWQFML